MHRNKLPNTSISYIVHHHDEGETTMTNYEPNFFSNSVEYHVIYLQPGQAITTVEVFDTATDALNRALVVVQEGNTLKSCNEIHVSTKGQVL